MRRLSSGPWQAKQLSERMGRISRSKSTGLSAAELTPATLNTRTRRIPKLPSVLDIIVNHMGCSGEAVKRIALVALVPAAAVSLQNLQTPDSGFFADVTN